VRAKHYILAGAFAYVILVFSLAIMTDQPWASYCVVPLFVIAYGAYFVFLDSDD
jgi:hypothetical protein